jgi:hypothetical protein
VTEPIAPDLRGETLQAHGDPRADGLDRQLAALAASGAPLRRALARIAARLVATRAWEKLGFVRLADYAREEPGLSARELRDLAHVDGVLARLPRIEAAFVSGRISWTRTRLLCRVATAEDEEHWLAAAEGMTATALAREVRAVDCAALEATGANPGIAAADEPETDEEGAPEAPRAVLHVHCAQRVLSKWGPLRRLAERVCGERLPAGACAEWIAAEMLSALPVAADAAAPEPLARRCRARPSPADASPPGAIPEEGGMPLPGDAAGRAAHPGTPRPAAVASAPPAPGPSPAPDSAPGSPALGSPALGDLLRGLEDADAFELDRRLRRAAARVHGLSARIGPLLLRLAAGRGFCEAGFRGLDDYARERLGMSPRRARSLLYLERACLASPALAAAWRGGRLSYSQAQTLTPLFLADGSAPFHAAWTLRAGQVTVRRLEDDVDLALASGAFDPADLPALPAVGLGPELGLEPTVGLGPEGAGTPASEPPAALPPTARPVTAPPPAGLQTGAPHRDLDEDIPRRPSEGAVWRINLPADVARLFRATQASVQRRIERVTGRSATAGDALEAMFDHARFVWRLRESPKNIEHRIVARDGWRCTVPGCTSYRNLHAHHVTYRSAGGCDAPWNLTTLCAAHHHRAVHQGTGRSRLRISGLAPRGLRFEMPLGSWTAGDVRARGTAMG